MTTSQLVKIVFEPSMSYFLNPISYVIFNNIRRVEYMFNFVHKIDFFYFYL